MMPTILRMTSALALAIPLTFAAAAAAPQRALASYDGLWSVLSITDKGTCDRGYRYAIRIKGGSVHHADPSSSSFRINGRVAGGGAIRVSVARGNQSANGTGRISRNSGAGTWRSSAGECSGSWQAERRG